MQVTFAFSIALSARGLGPNGFSFEDSLMSDDGPFLISTLKEDLPGLYRSSFYIRWY